jgi:hypothetical protein
MNIWQIIPLIFPLLFAAMIIGLIWFVWAIFTGRMDLMGSGYEDAQREAKARIKADPSEVNDPTVWLPEFAQKTKVKAITESRGGWGFLSRAQYSHKIRVETVQKSQEQLDEEKRVYFEAKEKRS